MCLRAEAEASNNELGEALFHLCCVDQCHAAGHRISAK
jgi:hypothetical protein